MTSTSINFTVQYTRNVREMFIVLNRILPRINEININLKILLVKDEQIETMHSMHSKHR